MDLKRNSTNFPLTLSNLLSKVEHDEKDILQYHQKIVHEYFVNYPNNRGLLMVHGTGTGKTMLATSIADTMRSKYRVIILSAKSLQHNFKKEVRKYMKLKGSADDIEHALKNDYKFISFNAGNMLNQLSRMGKSVEEREYEKTLSLFSERVNLEGSLIIVDEAQNLFNGIVNGSKNATGLYRAIMDATDIKIVFLSATPIINDPFEIVPAYNMLHGTPLLPEDYDDFYNYYVADNNTVKNKDRFKNRIFGLTSYYGDWWESGGVTVNGAIVKRQNFPDQLPTIVEYVPMSVEQYVAYANARDQESQVKQAKVTIKNNMQKPKTDPGSTYRVASRQISNFLLPESVKIKKPHAYGYTKHIDRLTHEHLTNLDKYSPKMKKILENLRRHTGLAVVYSSFVTGEGLAVFAKVLEACGWRAYDPKKPKMSSEKVFTFVTGEVSAEERATILDTFNSRKNRDGEVIDLMLLSGAGAEGLDLKNVRSIHIMEPYWNYGRLMQIMARAIRYLSHEHFEDENDRTVQPYIYLSDYPKDFDFKALHEKINKGKRVKVDAEKTTDVHLYNKSIRTKVLIDRFMAAMVESSIDCSVHIKKSPPDVAAKIKCLMCAPTDMPLFHADVATDLKMSNPCQSPETTTVKARETEYDGRKYFYTKGDDGISVFEFKKPLNAYIELSHGHPHYAALLEKLT